MTHREGWLRSVALVAGALLVMALVAVGFANAGEEKAGTTAANFLTLGAGPRALSMGGATLGLGRDVAGSAWNPAALGWVDESEIVVSHAGLENQSLQEWVGIGGRVGQTGTRWGIEGTYQGDGSFEARDASNNVTGSFSVSSFAIGGRVAQQFTPNLSVGVGVKTVSEKLGDASGIGTTFDAGFSVRHGVFGFGVAAQNLGGHMAYSGAAYDFPTNIGAGLAVSHPGTGLSLAVDANFPSAYYSDVRAGVEYRWKEMVAVRTGYRHELNATEDPLTGPTFGVGAGANGFWLDYGYLLSGSGSNGQHRVALTFLPGRWSGMGQDPFGQADFDKTKVHGPEPAPKGKK